MDQELKAELLKWMQATSQFVHEQAPLAAQDILWSEQLRFSIILGCLVFAFIAVIVVARAIYNSCENDLKKEDLGNSQKSDIETSQMMVTVGSIIVSIVNVCFMIVNIYWLAVIYYAPRAYLIDMLK